MSKKESLILALFLIAAGIAGRLLPHPWNMTPVTAIALFSSAYLGPRYTVGVFLSTMVVTDIFLGFYQWQVMLAVYGSFIVSGALGLILRKKKTIVRIGVAAIASSVAFFLVTNWAVWQFGSMYSASFSGLIQSYAMGLPFFRNSLIGDLFYTGVFFGIYEAVKLFVFSRKTRAETASRVS